MKLDELKYWLSMINANLGCLLNKSGFSWNKEAYDSQNGVSIEIHEMGKSLNYLVIRFRDYTDYNDVRDCVYIEYENKLIIFYNKETEEVTSIYRDHDAKLIVEDKENNSSFPVKIKDYERIDEDEEKYNLEVVINEDK